MRPYIVINGKESTNVNGLMIQKLPPITRPKMRTEVEEIDGRDGDIVTPLGFSAYDKEIEIGLYGQYDVNDVLSFFDTSGKITFSNEPDKYYKFAIYNQIDLEKLVRFRTAVVTMHVQPFKYSAIEGEVTTNTDSLTIRNRGNVVSKPRLSLTGEGILKVYLNENQIFQIDMTTETIIIDSEELNAYAPDGTFLNRHVVGSYDDFVLKSGINEITIDGTVTEMSILNYSRWL